jgi:hypothetical protein
VEPVLSLQHVFLSTCACRSSLRQLCLPGQTAPLIIQAVRVNITMDPALATNLGVYDNTQLMLFDPNSQALGSVDSYLNKTGEPNERAFLTPFSLYYNFGLLMRYTVGYSCRRMLKSTWRDIVGLPGVREICFCVI